MNIILLLLAGGVPYYFILEKNKIISTKSIFLLSSFLLFLAIVLSSLISASTNDIVLIFSLFFAIFSLYKATKTTNFYKLGYYLISINTPFFLLFIKKQGSLYSLSLLLTLIGIYFIARHYEKYYGSANYHSITGTTLATPYLGTFLTLYLLTLALYPPFPNALFMLSSMIQSQSTLLSYIVVIILFLGNFLLAMRVVARTVFGSPNHTLHYVDFSLRDRVIHFTLLFVLIGLSIIGFKGAIL